MKTAVVAIARLEGNYLQEWVDHYKNLGFTNIILCDNDWSEDDEDVKEILKEDIESGFIIYEDWRNQKTHEIGKNVQMYAYSVIYEKYKDQFDWLAFFDIDEQLELIKHKSIDDFLADKNDYEVVLINWFCFGDANQVVADFSKPLKERFTIPCPVDIKVQYDFPENLHIKSIVKGGLPHVIFYSNPHIPTNPLRCCNASGLQANSSPFQPIDFSTAYLKHYVTKSLQEWMENKMKRGVPDRTWETFIKTYPNRYFKYNQVTDEKLNWLKEHGYVK